MYITHKDMRPTLGSSLSDIQLHGAEGVDGKPLVRVDGNTKETRIGVDELIHIPNCRVPQNASIVKISQT